MELLDLHKRFGETVALDGMTLRVPEGRIVGFVGANGSGKTTTMRIALGVMTADSGQALLDGRPIDSTARQRFGYMPEERGLYPKMRVADQITYFATLHGADREGAREATSTWLAKLGVLERADDRVESLSLGNQQRVQLAAALVHDPIYLVLDEPFSGLDPLGVDVMSGVLREQVSRGVGVVFSSHQLELVERICDEVVIIRDGKVEAAGTVTDLSQAAGRFIRLVTSAPPTDWAAEYHVERTAATSAGHETLLVVAEGVSADGALRAAMDAGTVFEFAPVAADLSVIYREVVTR